MFILRSGMGIIQSLKAKFAGRKAAKGAKSKPSFRAWAKANGHEVGQGNVGELMRLFLEQTKPTKAGVRAAIAAEVATAISGKVPAVVDHKALDEVTKASAKSGSLEAVALRASLSLESELPATLEADVDRASELINSGRQREGLALLKSALAQLQTTLPAAKDAPKSPTDAASASKASGSSLSTPNAKSIGTSFPPSPKAEGVPPSAPSVAKPSRIATSSKPTAAVGAIQLSDKAASSAEAVRKERVKRLLDDAGLPLQSLEGIWWSADGEKALRSSRDILKRQFEGAKSWRERQPLEELVLATLAGQHQPVDLFRRFKFLADDKDGRTILR